MPKRYTVTDPLGRTVILEGSILFGHIYRRHRELKNKHAEILETVKNPDYIAQSKKDPPSLLYFRKGEGSPFILLAVVSPKGKSYIIKTSFYVLNTAKGDPILWQKKTSI